MNAPDRRSLVPVVGILAAFIVALHLVTAIAGRSAIRAAHIGPALNYARDGIDLFHPVIAGFNAGGTPIAQEFPLWQAAVASVFKVTRSTWYGWANIVSLVFFAAGLWPFFRLANEFVGLRAAWWSMVCYLAQPVIIFNAGSGGTDGLCLTVMVWFVFCANRMLRTGKPVWFGLALIFAVATALSKAPFFMAAGWFVFFLLVQQGANWRGWAGVAFIGVTAILLFGAWTRYTDFLAAQAEFPYVDVRLTHSPFIRYWYYGDWHYRLSPGPWLKGAWRLLHVTLGVLPMAVLFIVGLIRPGNGEIKLWLAACAVTTLVFSHLVLEHTHYFLMASPAVALLCGSVIGQLEAKLNFPALSRWWVTAATALVFVACSIDGLQAMKVVNDYDGFSQEMGGLIRARTDPSDKLIILGEGQWGGPVLLAAERQGLSVFDLDHRADMPEVKGLRELLENDPSLKRLKALGYTKVVLLSESPLRFAVSAVNPGTPRQRLYYPGSVSARVDAWPTVYQSPDVLIKQIP